MLRPPVTNHQPPVAVYLYGGRRQGAKPLIRRPPKGEQGVLNAWLIFHVLPDPCRPLPEIL